MPLQKHALVKSTYVEDYYDSSAAKEKIREQYNQRERFHAIKFSDVFVYRETV